MWLLSWSRNTGTRFQDSVSAGINCNSWMQQTFWDVWGNKGISYLLKIAFMIVMSIKREVSEPGDLRWGAYQVFRISSRTCTVFNSFCYLLKIALTSLCCQFAEESFLRIIWTQSTLIIHELRNDGDVVVSASFLDDSVFIRSVLFWSKRSR